MTTLDPVGMDFGAVQMSRAEASLSSFEHAHERELNAHNPVSRLVFHGLARYRHWQAVGDAQSAELASELYEIDGVLPQPAVEHTDQ